MCSFNYTTRPPDPVTLWRGAFERAVMSEHVCVCVLMYACVTVHRWCLKDKCDVGCVSFFISQWGYGLMLPTDSLRLCQLSLSLSLFPSHSLYIDTFRHTALMYIWKYCPQGYEVLHSIPHAPHAHYLTLSFPDKNQIVLSTSDFDLLLWSELAFAPFEMVAQTGAEISLCVSQCATKKSVSGHVPACTCYYIALYNGSHYRNFLIYYIHSAGSPS